ADFATGGGVAGLATGGVAGLAAGACGASLAVSGSVGAGLAAAGAAAASSSVQPDAASALLRCARSSSPNSVSAIELLMSSIDFATAIARIVCVWRNTSASSDEVC